MDAEHHLRGNDECMRAAYRIPPSTMAPKPASAVHDFSLMTAGLNAFRSVDGFPEQGEAYSQKCRPQQSHPKEFGPDVFYSGTFKDN